MAIATEQDRPRAFYPDGTDVRPRRATPGWDMGPDRRFDDGRSAARALGWFSIGLGAVELFAPHVLTDFLGLDEDRDNLVRLLGVRELAHGVAILSDRTPTAGVWSRLGGDALDLAALGIALGRDEVRRDRVALAMAMVAGVGVVDGLAARKLQDRSSDSGRGGAS